MWTGWVSDSGLCGYQFTASEMVHERRFRVVKSGVLGLKIIASFPSWDL